MATQLHFAATGGQAQTPHQLVHVEDRRGLQEALLHYRRHRAPVRYHPVVGVGVQDGQVLVERLGCRLHLAGRLVAARDQQPVWPSAPAIRSSPTRCALPATTRSRGRVPTGSCPSRVRAKYRQPQVPTSDAAPFSLAALYSCGFRDQPHGVEAGRWRLTPNLRQGHAHAARTWAPGAASDQHPRASTAVSLLVPTSNCR